MVTPPCRRLGAAADAHVGERVDRRGRCEMETPREDWRTPETRALVRALLALRTEAEVERFLRDLCTLGELRDLGQRWAVAGLLADGLHYSDISRRTGASTATITRIASWLRHGEGGYALALERTRGGGPDADPIGRDAAR
jgi:TrpR-related protein YerC/YecD